jgi:hypothetical protein
MLLFGPPPLTQDLMRTKPPSDHHTGCNHGIQPPRHKIYIVEEKVKRSETGIQEGGDDEKVKHADKHPLDQGLEEIDDGEHEEEAYGDYPTRGEARAGLLLSRALAGPELAGEGVSDRYHPRVVGAGAESDGDIGEGGLLMGGRKPFDAGDGVALVKAAVGGVAATAQDVAATHVEVLGRGADVPLVVLELITSNWNQHALTLIKGSVQGRYEGQD